MSGIRENRHVVAMVGNPTSDKGRGAKVDAQVLDLLEHSGEQYGFDVVDLTGSSFDDSLARAREHAGEYDYLVVVGGDGMVGLGANAVGFSGKPLGIVAIGSGNDFARGLKLPINRVETSVEGIVGAMVCGSHIDVDMGRVTSLEGGYAVDPSTGREYEQVADAGETHPIDRYYAGMLSCGLDASINDYANHSHLPNGTVRYMVGVLVKLTHMASYGYHVKATLADGSTDERDIISPMLTVANSRYVGGGIAVCPYSCLDDGLLDLVWLEHMPNVKECAVALSNAYNGRLLASQVFGWERVSEIEITRAESGTEPPILMADGEYVGCLPVRVSMQRRALRVLVPPAVAAQSDESEQLTLEAIRRDGRDPLTGRFV
ncbi:diacylglycerol/lipid kinase family protein [Bifidobacterium oedipodis]|uniref:DeoR family transcriptional regulator n=1 Tax=Bifidobacterium oedipodis TaxID=2675322 RepID=A0A7Y0HQV6_9BIFI|nr:diacylglycerol kinase family protein [Bifidobacterium sp. DSM 109957]NMM93330.1 DeoR family transcriptional regulator [Bifidobacterium sp. DSM 109957]